MIPRHLAVSTTTHVTPSVYKGRPVTPVPATSLMYNVRMENVPNRDVQEDQPGTKRVVDVKTMGKDLCMKYDDQQSYMKSVKQQDS